MGRNAPLSDMGEKKGPKEKQTRTYATSVLITAIAAILLVSFVETIVIPGIPVIQKDLSTTDSVASWITSAFLIVGAAVAPLFGKLGDIYGKKRMFMLVLACYIVGVGIAGLASSITVLLIARAIQGIGFASLPLGLALVTDVYPRDKVAVAQGIISGMVAVGAVIGLVVGAYIMQYLNWHDAFYLAFIISMIVFILAFKILRNDIPTVKRKMDYLGTFILMVGVTLVLVYLTEAPTIGWITLESMAFLAPGIVLTVYFFIFENRTSSPLIQLGLLKVRNVLMANLIGLASSMAMFLAFFAIIYYAEYPVPYGLGLDVLTTGLTVVPAAIVMMVTAPFVGRMLANKGPRPMVISGALVMALGFIMFILNRSSQVMICIDSTIALFGVVTVMIPMTNMISMSMPTNDVTTGLGFNSMLRNLGGAVGPVLATTILTTFTVSLFVSEGGTQILVGTMPSSTAFDVIFFIGMVLSALIVLMGLFIKNYKFSKEVDKKKL